MNISATKYARERDGHCLYGLLHRDGCSAGLDGHHIKTRGAGGDDVPENIISLCRKHHDLAALVNPNEFYAILARYHGYKYDDIGPWQEKDWM